MANPSIELFPSGFKATKLYSQIPTDGTGDFTHARSTVSTRVNSIGVVENIAIDVPRSEFTEGVCQVLSLEPQSTNLYLNNAVMVTQNVTTLASDYTVSFYGTGTITFTGTHTGSLVGTGTNDRVTTTFTATAGTLTSTVTVTVTDGQVENLGFATSVIVTLGTTVTRTLDVCSNSGDVNDFNSEEGVLYAEFKSFEQLNSTTKYIQISDGTFDNRVALIMQSGATNQVRTFYRVGGSAIFDKTAVLSDISILNKFAVKWKVNDFAFWVNGVELFSQSTGAVNSANTFDTLNFLDIAGNNFFGRVKTLRVYKIALSDAELTTLTT